MRCRWSLPLAAGRCCCCHRCCQLGAGRPVASRPAPCRGWPASDPGRLLPGPCLLTGVPAEAPGSSVTSRVRSPGNFTCPRCPAVTVTLDAGGAGTYTQRAIPGSEPSQDSCTFRPDTDLMPSQHPKQQVILPLCFWSSVADASDLAMSIAESDRASCCPAGSRGACCDKSALCQGGSKAEAMVLPPYSL